MLRNAKSLIWASVLVAVCLAGCARTSPIDRRLERAALLLRDHKVNRARAEIDAAIAADPARTDTYLTAMVLYGSRKLHRDRARSAEQLLARARVSGLDRRMTPFEQGEVSADLGSAYWELREMAKAEKALREGVSLAPRSPVTLNALGYFYADEGMKLKEAEGLIRRALAAAPQDGMIIDSLGWVQYKRGDYPAAVETLREAVRLSPNEPEIRYHLAAAYAKRGLRAEASVEARKSLALNPDMPEARALLKALSR